MVMLHYYFIFMAREMLIFCILFSPLLIIFKKNFKSFCFRFTSFWFFFFLINTKFRNFGVLLNLCVVIYHKTVWTQSLSGLHMYSHFSLRLKCAYIWLLVSAPLAAFNVYSCALIKYNLEYNRFLVNSISQSRNFHIWSWFWRALNSAVGVKC